MALRLLTQPDMPEPTKPQNAEVDDSEEHVERRVVYESRSSTSSRSSAITMIIVVVIALALIAWIVMQMR